MLGDFILNLQRLARGTSECAFRTQALALLRQVIPFESGSWGTTKPDGVGVKLCSVQLLGQTEAILQRYEAIRAHDRAGQKTVANPGQSQILSWRDGYGGANGAFRAYCENFSHFNILSTMSQGLLGMQHNFITVARSKGSPCFVEADRAGMQQLLPHLLDAWILNRSWHMQKSPDADQANDLISGICSTTGDLLGDHPAFAQLIANEFPGWSPPRLPPSLMAGLEQQGCWRRKRLVVQTYPVADVVFLTARIAHEIDKLTPREMMIAREAAEGFSYKEIARSLGLSPATIRAHLHNIYGKLEISNKTALSRAMSAGRTAMPGDSYLAGAPHKAAAPMLASA